MSRLAVTEIRQRLVVRGGPTLFLTQKTTRLISAAVQGPRGVQGEPGTASVVPGPEGLSAYEVAAVNGFVGTETEWLASLEGPQGDPGNMGYRVMTLPDVTPITPNVDVTDLAVIAELSQISVISNPAGTPVDGQRLLLRIKSTVSHGISFGDQYRASEDLSLPIGTSGGGKTDYLAFSYNSTDEKWDFIASNFGF